MPQIIFNLYFDLWAQVDCFGSKKRFDRFLNDTQNKTKRNFLCISLSDVKRSIEVMVKSVNPVATREKENSKGQDALHWRNHQVTISIWLSFETCEFERFEDAVVFLNVVCILVETLSCLNHLSLVHLVWQFKPTEELLGKSFNNQEVLQYFENHRSSSNLSSAMHEVAVEIQPESVACSWRLFLEPPPSSHQQW